MFYLCLAVLLDLDNQLKKTLQILVTPEVHEYITLGEAASEKLKTKKGMHSEKQHLPDEIQDVLFYKRPWPKKYISHHA